MAGINIRSVAFSYPDRQVFSHLNLKIKPGEFLGISGLNGSGKTTLLYLLNGLIPHEIKGKFKGEVLIDDLSTRKNKVHSLSKKVGLVFQNPDFSLFNLTVKDEIAFGRPQADVTAILKLIGLSGYADRDPQSLSFGQKQLVSLAAVLAMDTPYLLLDEPTAMLDYKNSLNLYRLLLQLNQQGKTIIIADHDTELLARYCQRIIILDQGKIKLNSPAKTIFKHTVKLNRLGIRVPKL